MDARQRDDEGPDLSAFLTRRMVGAPYGEASRLARAVGVSPGAVSRLRDGKTRPKWATFSLIANYYDMSRAQLLAVVDGEPLPPPSPDRLVEAIRREPSLHPEDRDHLVATLHVLRRARQGRPAPPR